MPLSQMTREYAVSQRIPLSYPFATPLAGSLPTPAQNGCLQQWALDATAREAVEKNVRGYRVLQLVGDLANGGKHLVLNPQFASGLEPDITKKDVAFDFGRQGND